MVIITINYYPQCTRSILRIFLGGGRRTHDILQICTCSLEISVEVMSITKAHTSWKDVLSTEQEDNSSENRKKSKCIIIFMMMKSQQFSDLMASGNLLPAFGWCQNCDYRLQTWRSVLVSVCIECIQFSQTKRVGFTFFTVCSEKSGIASWLVRAVGVACGSRTWKSYHTLWYNLMTVHRNNNCNTNLEG